MENEQINGYPVEDEKIDEINNWFQYHSPKAGQNEKYEQLRSRAKELALLIMNLTPPCADQSASIRKLRECIMTANAAIACNE